MRSRELWLWLGGALLTLGTVLSAIALASFTRDRNFSLYTSWQFVAFYVLFPGAFGCFLCAIMGWRFPGQRRFPKLRIDVSSAALWPTTMSLAAPRRICFVSLHFISEETDRSLSIKDAFVIAKTSPSLGYNAAFFLPKRKTDPYALLNLRPIRFPVNLEPGASDTGELLFEELVPDFPLAEPFAARVVIEDARTGKRMCFPAKIGTFRKGHGLQPTTSASLARRQSGRSWRGTMGRPDP